MKLFVQSLVIKVERKDEYTEMQKMTAAYFASKEWVVERPWHFNKEETEVKRKSGKKASGVEVQYFGTYLCRRAFDFGDRVF